MAATPSSLPLTPWSKFVIPPRPPDLLRRSRLIDFLHENIHRKLVILAAAAGYGKSTLAIEFAHDTDYAVAWCRLDEIDRDLTTLAADILTALKQIFQTFPADLSQLAGQPAPQPSELALALAHHLGTNTDRYFVLVLEDFHFIRDSPDVVRFFDTLLAALPEQAHLLLASRSE